MELVLFAIATVVVGVIAAIPVAIILIYIASI